MKVLALIGSPRRRGNTDIMADEVLAGAAAAEALAACRELGARAAQVMRTPGSAGRGGVCI